MKTYEYQVLRYLPDRVSGEFVNVGLVLFQAESRFVKAGFIRSVSRVSSFFPGLDGRNLQRRLRHLEAMLEGYADRLNIDRQVRLERPTNLESVTNRFLVKDDTALQFSEVKYGLDDDLELTFDELYDRMVENYTPEVSEDIRTDYDVWKKLYRPLFEKRNITDRLQAHKVTTAKDVIEFPYAWKNEIWHCYEPVTFDLKKSDSVKNKVYRWVGRLDELRTAEEPITLQLLAALPTDDPELMAFVLDKLDNKVFGSATVSVVKQQEAEQFTRQVHEEIIEHETK
ncbi:DUF3037 domain-containing protein [Spirosoma sp. HMF4905]|uniref:DUF3037 domain-containing protein n=1 Tax=Spirosoma arboris TaxID=2682092 RepID=A0A7K1SLQ5_9BACT|nr:DUF3037 domain-containing protein [Spirosoma arboris]MVM34740.1 DUF3037 domain-containing protein [Spirosoma arboris]